MMPGKIVSPERSLAIRLSRSSSFTLRARSLGSENALLRSSPRVRGRFMRGPLTPDYTLGGQRFWLLRSPEWRGVVATGDEDWTPTTETRRHGGHGEKGALGHVGWSESQSRE